MAVDEAVLEAVGRGEAQPTLRLYAWEPACLSLGYAQPVSDVDFEALRTHGWDLVRRPTGGRAILHVDELTYSVVGPAVEPRLAGSVLESYRNLSEALLWGLRSLGAPAQSLPKPERNGPRAPANPVCFEAPSNYEITVEGKKLIGSAQARRKEGVLQHGSFPLYGDLARITQALTFPSPERRQQAAERLLARATTAEWALGRRVSWEEAAEAVAEGFRQALNLELEPGELTEEEQGRAEELAEGKYGGEGWTRKERISD